MATKTVLRYFIYNFALVCTSDSSYQYTCEKQNDCFSKRNVICGFCVKRMYEGIGNCVFPFDIFESNPSCLLKKHCKDNCNDRGYCMKVEESYVCLCDVGFYGNSCKYITPPQLTGIIPRQIGYKVVTNINQFEYKLLQFSYSCDSKDASTHFNVEILTHVRNGYYESLRQSRSGCRGWTPTNNKRITINLLVRFPYVLGIKLSSEFLSFEGKVLGYLTTYEIRYTVGLQELTMSQPGKIFVSYDKSYLYCVPVVKLLDCATSKYKPVDFTRSRYNSILSYIETIADGRYVKFSYEADCSKSRAIYHWRLWRNEYSDINLPTIEVWGKNRIAFRPFSLLEGTYRVLLEVKTVTSGSSLNFAYCYFRVQLEPLIVVLEGGSKRTIIREDGFILDARRSKDPNQRLDNQTFLYATWNCVQVQDVQQRDICENKTLPVSEVYKVSPDKLVSEGVYNVKLTVWTDLYDKKKVPPAVSSVEIKVNHEFIAFQCLLNCEGKVITTEIIILKVKKYYAKNSYLPKSRPKLYQWTYFEEGQSKEENISRIGYITDENQSSMLTIKKNTLAKGKSYNISVRHLNLNIGATYSFETEKEFEFNISCFVEPTKGIIGISLFDIICESESSLNLSLTYEFYDKYPEEDGEDVIFSGRMIGTSSIGRLENIKLTRGTVCVFILSGKALQTSKKMYIELSKSEISQEIIDNKISNIYRKVNDGQGEEAFGLISVVADMVSDKIDRSEVLDKLLHIIVIIPVKCIPNMKLGTSTLYNLLIQLNRPTPLIIQKPEIFREVLKTVYNQTGILRNSVGVAESLQAMTPTEIREVAKYQLNSMHIALSCRNPKTERVNEFDYDLEILYALMESSNYIENIINLVQDILTFLQAPGQSPTQMEAKNNATTVWVLKHDQDFKITKYLNKPEYRGIPISLSDKSLGELEKYADNNRGYLSVRVVKIEDEIFWWRISDIKSNFISVSPVVQTQKKFIKEIEKINGHIKLSINLKPSIRSTKISGSIRIDTKVETFDIDKTIQTHRLDLIPNSILTLKFLFPQTNGSLRVIVTSHFRPSSSSFLRKREVQIIEEEHPNYLFGPYREKNIYHHEKESFVYVGILPTHTNLTTSYTFEINNTICQKWVRGQWSSKGCKTVNKHNLEVICECQHFSTFAAAFPVPLQDIDPFEDVKLFLTVPNNPLVVSFVSAIILLYIVLCIWARCRDKVDRKSRTVVILEDNFSGDHYPYLLAVYTSSRINAGTTANVGFKLIGEYGQSRAHILKSKDHKVLKRTYDDWFLIFCPQYLGTLQSIHIWHDNAGSNPDWFLSKIIVYDLTTSIEYIFIFEDWLNFRPQLYPEATVTSATIHQVSNFRRMFYANCALGFRESHSFFAVLLRHPRSQISRLQRVSTYMCLLAVAMLCSTFFYTIDVKEEGVDESLYAMEMKAIYITIEGLLITLALTFFVLFAFKRSFKYHPVDVRNKCRVHYRRSRFSKLGTSASIQKSSRGRCAQFFIKALKDRPLLPAHLPHCKPTVVVRVKWLIIGWVLCLTTILVCSFLVMLYGLKLGEVKSAKWLTFVFMMIAEEIILIGPAKVVSYAAVLAIALQQMYHEDTHQVTLRDAKEIKLPEDEEYVRTLMMKRNQSIYRPISTDITNTIIKKRLIRYQWWTVIEFSIALISVAVITIVMFKLWSAHYYSNSHISNLVIYCASLDTQKFYSIKFIEDLENYLQTTFILSLYSTFWYNQMPIKNREYKTYYTEDIVHSFVGLQQLRQIRVIPKKCELKFMNTDKNCIPPYSSESEDTDVYSVNWKYGEFQDKEKEYWPWKFTRKTGPHWFHSYRLFGASGRLYGSGGYLILLGPMRDNVQKTMLELIGDDWQDLLTKAVILEFTVYNANLDLLSQVTMIVEYLIEGQIQLKVKVTSVKTAMNWKLWNGLLLVFLLYDVIVTGFQINRIGLIEFLKGPSNLIRLIVIILVCLCIAVAVTHYFKSTSYYNQFVKRGKDDYFDFDEFIFYFLILQDLFSLLLAASMFYTFAIFRGGRTFLNHMYTLLLAGRYLIWLILMNFLFLAVYIHFFIVLNIFSTHSIQGIVIDSTSIKCLKSDNRKFTIGMLFIVKTIVTAIISGLLIMVFMYYIRIAKTYKIRRSDEFNMFTFFMQQFRKK